MIPQWYPLTFDGKPARLPDNDSIWLSLGIGFFVVLGAACFVGLWVTVGMILEEQDEYRATACECKCHGFNQTEPPGVER